MFNVQCVVFFYMIIFAYFVCLSFTTRESARCLNLLLQLYIDVILKFILSQICFKKCTLKLQKALIDLQTLDH